MLLQYPNRAPNKLAGLYRGPLVITAIERPDLIKIKDLVTNRESLVHASRLRLFQHPPDMSREEMVDLAAIDLDEFHFEKNIEHRRKGKNPTKWEYRVRWSGYEEGDDSWLPWSSVKDVTAMDD